MRVPGQMLGMAARRRCHAVYHAPGRRGVTSSDGESEESEDSDLIGWVGVLVKSEGPNVEDRLPHSGEETVTLVASDSSASRSQDIPGSAKESPKNRNPERQSTAYRYGQDGSMHDEDQKQSNDHHRGTRQPLLSQDFIGCSKHAGLADPRFSGRAL